MRRANSPWTSWAVAAVVVLPGVLFVVPLGTPASAPAVATPLPPVPPTLPSVAPAAPRVTVAAAFAPGPGVVSLGPRPATQPMEVAVGLAPTHGADLAALVAAEYAPDNPMYRAFATSVSLSARFGPSEGTITEATAYFTGFGLSVSRSPDGLILFVQGSPASVGRAFGTTFQEYREPGGRVVTSHATPATLPTGVPWTGALGLGDVTPIVPASALAGPRVALAGPSASCGSGPAGLSPCQLANAYNLSSLTSNGTDGSGTRIGIVDAYSGSEPQTQLSADFASFTSEFGLPSGGVSYRYPVPTTLDLNVSTVNPAWGLEEALDLEWARAAAPGASIDMTFSPDAGAGLYAAVDALVAADEVNVLSLSWGEPDVGVFNAFSQPCPSACNASTDGSYALLGPVLEFAAAEGITVLAASGDCGAADGTSSVSTNFPASDPYVTGVGGTSLAVAADGSYLSESAWSGNQTGSTSPGCQNQGGSGGGYAPFPRPWWQNGLPSGSTGRGVPDVAMDAGTPVSIVFGGRPAGVVGTSAGTPIWAGIAAVADQRSGTPLGFLDPSLYRAAAGPNGTRDFHDILTGSNGYLAGPGWDPVTGLGTPNVATLVTDLALAPVRGATAPGAFLYASPRFGPAPLNVSFVDNLSVAAAPYALEGIAFGDGNASLGSGLTYHTYPSPGVYSAVAYAIDAEGNTTVSSPIAIVVGGGSALSVALNASTQTPPTGFPVAFRATVEGGVGPYRYSFSFGDGTYTVNGTSASVVHAYPTAGGFCAEVVVRDGASPPDGGASGRVALAVGGAPVPSCGNPIAPLALAPLASGTTRDAPADFPTLFETSGGAPAPLGLSTSVRYLTNDSYVTACGCAILRSPGNYTVRAWANDTVNDQATAVANVTVAPPLVGVFAASTLSGPAPLTVHFFSAVHGGYLATANETFWIFGNGDTGFGHSVNETYRQPGEYVAVGRISDAGFGNTSEAFLLYVYPSGPIDRVGITGTISPAIDVVSGTAVSFSAELVTPPSEGPLLVGWALGGGFAAYGFGANQTYFDTPAEFPTNQLQGTVSAMLPNTVVVVSRSFSLGPFFAVESGGLVPRASAIGLQGGITPTLGLLPFTLFANGTASGPGGGSVTWVFGDGSLTSGDRIEHPYYAAGDYTVLALGRDGFGDRAVDSFGLVANGPLSVLGGPSPAGGVPPVNITFNVLGLGGTGPPYAYRWTFQNGSTFSNATVTVRYPGLGVYRATVSVTDSSGKTVNRTFVVVIHPPASLSAGEILGLGTALGAALAVVELGGWLKRRPGRPTLSQRRAARAVRRVV